MLSWYGRQSLCLVFAKSAAICSELQTVRVISIFAGPESFRDLTSPFHQRKHPTVSTIINKTMPLENAMILRRWQTKMKQQMGEKGFNEYMTRIKLLGREVHQTISDLLLHEKMLSEIPTHLEGYLSSLEPVLSKVTATHLVEHDCYHPALEYRGRFDSMNAFQTQLGPFVLTEWKTVHDVNKRVTSLEKAYDAPLQVAAYVGAYNISRAPEMPEIRQGLIAYAYADGYPADIFIIGEQQLEHFWKLWCTRIEIYQDLCRNVN